MNNSTLDLQLLNLTKSINNYQYFYEPISDFTIYFFSILIFIFLCVFSCVQNLVL